MGFSFNRIPDFFVVVVVVVVIVVVVVQEVLHECGFRELGVSRAKNLLEPLQYSSLLLYKSNSMEYVILA